MNPELVPNMAVKRKMSRFLPEKRTQAAYRVDKFEVS
jgi:hypothetical protein